MGRLSPVLALELPEDVGLAALVLAMDEGVADQLARGEIEAVHPGCAHDLSEEVLDHGQVSEEEAVAAVVSAQGAEA